MRPVDDVARAAETPAERERIPVGEARIARIEHEVARLSFRPVAAGMQPGVEEAEVVLVAGRGVAHARSIPPTAAGPRLNATVAYVNRGAGSAFPTVSALTPDHGDPMKHIQATFLALAVAATGVAAAAPQAAGGRTRIDTNNDGAIDRTEAAAHPRLAQRFDQLDANRDGRLDRTERPKHGMGGKHGRGGGGLERIVRLDANQDGRIARTEVGQSNLAQHFDRFDTNRDGYLVHSELRAGRERMRAEHQRTREQKATERFQQADRNRDGRLTRDEAQQAMPRMAQAFAFLDENRDGFLSQAEIHPRRTR